LVEGKRGALIGDFIDATMVNTISLRVRRSPPSVTSGQIDDFKDMVCHVKNWWPHMTRELEEPTIL